jgi:hypothetical protein
LSPRAERCKRPLERICSSVDSFDEDDQDRLVLPALLEKEILGAMNQERNEDLNLVPPEEGFELYRYKNAEKMRTSGWSGLYWARKNEAGDYEIRAVTAEGEGYSYPGGVFSEVAFERYYEKAN